MSKYTLHPDEEFPLDEFVEPPPPPWHPAQHALDVDVRQYTPARVLTYHQGKGHVHPVLLAAAGFVLGWLVGALWGGAAFWMVVSCSFVGSYLLVLWKSGAFTPIRWHFSLDQRTLSIDAGEEEFVYDLSEATSIVLRLEEREQWWSSTLSGVWKSYRYAQYNAQILIAGILEDDADLVIANTGFLQSNPEDVRRTGRAFAYMLAEALDVPVRELPLDASSATTPEHQSAPSV